MKYSHCIAIILLLLLFIILAIGTALAQAPPEVTTNAATDVTSDSATLNGNLTSLGNASSVDVWFQYATNTYYTSNGNTYNNSTAPQPMSIAAPFSSPIGSLSPGTTYHFMATAMAGNDTANGTDTTFTTAASFNLQGWGWCTNLNKVTAVTFEGYTTTVERTGASNSYSMHTVGNLTLQQPYNETVSLDMYGSRVRSLFYLREEMTGKSASLQGTWLDTSGNQSYIAIAGAIGLPNPDGQVLKTARLCFVYLRTPDVEVPLTEPGSFVQDVESMLTRSVKLVDKVVDSLLGTGFSDILSNILTKIAVLLAQLSALGTPYVP